MLPIVDYGGMAIVVPKISAVSGVKPEGNGFGFDVHLGGGSKPVTVVFDSREQADENRDELVVLIARYYYLKDFGPDFDPDNIDDMLIDRDEEEADDEGDENKKDKH